MDFESLTPDQQERPKACKTAEELVSLAKAEGMELSDADLEAISGVRWICSDKERETFTHYSDC